MDTNDGESSEIENSQDDSELVEKLWSEAGMSERDITIITEAFEQPIPPEAAKQWLIEQRIMELNLNGSLSPIVETMDRLSAAALIIAKNMFPKRLSTVYAQLPEGETSLPPERLKFMARLMVNRYYEETERGRKPWQKPEDVDASKYL